MNGSRRTGATLALACVLASQGARADAIESCTSAVASGQRLQRAGRLRDARASFLACVKPECPAEVKAVCDGLLTKLDAITPTLILGARTRDGQDLANVRVLADGVLLLSSLDGKAVSLDPGVHTLRFERAGSMPLEKTVVIREAEKERLLTVTLEEASAPGPPPAAPTARRSIPASVYVLGGVGVAALGGFAGLAGYGQSRYDQCHAHGCTSQAVSTLGVERGLAFGALGVGVVALAAATWLWIARPGATTAAFLSVAPARDGGGLGVAF